MPEVNHIFDSHAHYDDVRFAEDRDALLTRIHTNSVAAVLNVGCSLSSAQESVRLAEQYSFIYASVGIHPEDSLSVPPDYLSKLRQLAQHEKVVAIGEIGFDYHYEETDKPSQFKIFEEQMQLAAELDLPVIIHSRDAIQDTMDMLKRFHNRGVVHCYSGSPEPAQIYLELGYYIGFTGLVTFPKVKKVLETIETVPLNRILLETDCPYMAPVPYRGKRCSSEMIAYTAEAIAEIKGITSQKMVDIARENTCRLFGIKL